MGAIERRQARRRLPVPGANHLDDLGEHSDRHRQTVEHLEVLVGRATEGREVVADDEGVDAGRHAASCRSPRVISRPPA